MANSRNTIRDLNASILALREAIGLNDIKSIPEAESMGYTPISKIKGSYTERHLKSKLDALVSSGKATSIRVKGSANVATWYKIKS